MEKKATKKKKKKKVVKKEEVIEPLIDPEHIPLINQLYNVPSSHRRKIVYLFTEKPEGSKISHAYYRINFYNFKDNLMEASAFVDIEEIKKRLAIVDEKHPTPKGMLRSIFPSSDESWFHIYMRPLGKSRKKPFNVWIQITKADLQGNIVVEISNGES